MGKYGYCRIVDKHRIYKEYWLCINTSNTEQQDILEVLEKRYRVHSTILCSQSDVAGWHNKLGGEH